MKPETKQKKLNKLVIRLINGFYNDIPIIREEMCKYTEKAPSVEDLSYFKWAYNFQNKGCSIFDNNELRYLNISTRIRTMCAPSVEIPTLDPFG
jgi:hypothetical protein